MASEIHEIFYAFDPQLNTFVSVGIWLKYFRRKLLQFERSKAVKPMSSFISLTKLCFATSFYSCFEKGCLINGEKLTRQCRKLYG